MTHPERTAASVAGGRETLPARGHSGRAARARTEPMAVHPLRGGRYAVDTDGGSYVVDLRDGRCRCPDHDHRGARCKHLRRVAVEVTEGRVPPPDRREAPCAVCGDGLYVPVDDEGPFLCGGHRHAPGEVVVDRETATLLVVAGSAGERADEATADGREYAFPASRLRATGRRYASTPGADCDGAASATSTAPRPATRASPPPPRPRARRVRRR